MEALQYLFETLLRLYIVTFVIRLIMQWVRADFRNPLTQFILTVTNPLVMPLRRMLPPIGGLDTATLIVVLLLEMLLTFGVVSFSCVATPDIFQLVLLTIIRLARLTLWILMGAIFIYVLLSWISPGGYNPMTHLLASITEPVLRPIRKFIPPIGGIDLSPLFALIAINALIILLPSGVCPSFGRML